MQKGLVASEGRPRPARIRDVPEQRPPRLLPPVFLSPCQRCSPASNGDVDGSGRRGGGGWPKTNEERLQRSQSLMDPEQDLMHDAQLPVVDDVIDQVRGWDVENPSDVAEVAWFEHVGGTANHSQRDKSVFNHGRHRHAANRKQKKSNTHPPKQHTFRSHQSSPEMLLSSPETHPRPARTGKSPT